MAQKPLWKWNTGEGKIAHTSKKPPSDTWAGGALHAFTLSLNKLSKTEQWLIQLWDVSSCTHSLRGGQGSRESHISLFISNAQTIHFPLFGLTWSQLCSQNVVMSVVRRSEQVRYTGRADTEYREGCGQSQQAERACLVKSTCQASFRKTFLGSWRGWRDSHPQTKNAAPEGLCLLLKQFNFWMIKLDNEVPPPVPHAILH